MTAKQRPPAIAPARGLVRRAIDALLRRAPAAVRTWRRNYAAAQMSRLTEGWSTLNTSANADLHRSLDSLRARSRQLARDNDYAVKFLRLVTTNVVGQGFMLQSRIYDAPGKPDTNANDAVETAFAEWSRASVCEVTGRHSFRDLCTLLLRAAARDGEYLVRKVRGAAARNPHGYALQVLDVDRIDTLLNRPADGSRNAIRMGVEVDTFGRPVAYHLRDGHPGDLYQIGGAAANRHIVVPADEILHGFVADRPEQLRGVPWMHASMLRLNHLAGYEESAVVAARVGASKMGFFTTPDGQINPAATGVDGEAGSADERLMMDADPGVFQSLPEGVQFQPFNPDYPSAMFADFVKANLRAVASGLGVAYHALANDLEGVSFSSIRSGTLEERDQWQMLQAWFIDAFLEPVFADWLRSALAFGQVKLANGSALSVGKFDKFKAHLWQPRRWEWVDPLKDIEADIKAVDAGFKAPQDIAAKLGMDYEDVLVKIKQARELQERLGVEVGSSATPPPAPTPAPSEPDDDDQEEPKASARLHMALEDMANAVVQLAAAEEVRAAQHGALVQALSEQSRALLERPINVTVPVQMHEHHHHQRLKRKVPKIDDKGRITEFREEWIDAPPANSLPAPAATQ